jgi:hypothetical protein
MAATASLAARDHITHAVLRTGYAPQSHISTLKVQLPLGSAGMGSLNQRLGSLMTVL